MADRSVSVPLTLSDFELERVVKNFWRISVITLNTSALKQDLRRRLLPCTQLPVHHTQLSNSSSLCNQNQNTRWNCTFTGLLTRYRFFNHILVFIHQTALLVQEGLLQSYQQQQGTIESVTIWNLNRIVWPYTLPYTIRSHCVGW